MANNTYLKKRPCKICRKWFAPHLRRVRFHPAQQVVGMDGHNGFPPNRLRE